ncbi:MAG: ATP-binding protein, partial [Myxococcales bacterium]|nr:ATP-binding protein [Myxococcales bacterium]
LLIVNLSLIVVPIAGLEFARIYERQLLVGLEGDLRNQTVLVAELIGRRLRDGAALDDPDHFQALQAAARQTRTRLRLLDAQGQTRVDSHAAGPPEGPEPLAPTITGTITSPLGSKGADWVESARRSGRQARRASPVERWPEIAKRQEVVDALEGRPSGHTRLRERSPSVILFLSEPIRRADGSPVGVVYATRSTQSVMVQLYEIRAALIRVLLLAAALTLLLTLALAYSISRPLRRLAEAARRIAGGEQGVTLPRAGSTEIRDLAEAFAVMNERLDRRMRYMEEFSADIAHELKSPLTSIRGASELLQDEASEDPEARARFSRNIQLDAERMERLVGRLLELSRIDSSQEPMRSFDLRALIDRVVGRTDTSEHPVRIRDETQERRAETGERSALRYRGREAELERALLNLVENALRFSPPGLGVTLGVALEDRTLRLSVSDQGPGVPEADRERIFDRFFTTDAERDGTGLGLAIVRSVARAHGGEILLEAEARGGARFEMRLPLR